MYIQQQNPLQKQQQKKTSFCSPGSMSSYCDFRIRQLQGVLSDHDNENISINHAENEGGESATVGSSSDHPPILEDTPVEPQTTTIIPESSGLKCTFT